MATLAEYATKNCKFAGLSSVRTNSDGTISLSIQAKGDYVKKDDKPLLGERVLRRQEACDKLAAKLNPKPFWYCEKPKFPYSAGHESVIGDNALRLVA